VASNGRKISYPAKGYHSDRLSIYIKYGFRKNNMHKQSLGKLENVSRLSLGGGGIGQVWGKTSRNEAVATVLESYEAGINLFDMAPMYGNGEAETVMGLAFEGGYPADLKVTTKCLVGGVEGHEIDQKLRRSLAESCERMQRDYVDVYILHGYVIADGWRECLRPKALPHIAVEWSNYLNFVIKTFEALKAEGKIGAWGITAASTQATNLQVLETAQKPDVIQCIANVLDAPGSMAICDEIPDPRSVIQRAQQESVGVMGIRAVAAGSLTDAIDREVKPTSSEALDFEKAEKFRRLAAETGVSSAFLAHRYALSMLGVDTVVLGVKDRVELNECLEAEAAGSLDQATMNKIDLAISTGNL
jgi:aryl-alcohol dehydrogenase-like predicted oxidoreductase